MAFNTKLKFSDSKFYQEPTDTIHLSGDTIINGNISYDEQPTITGATQLVTKQYVDNQLSGATGGTIYDLLSPAVCSVGGIDAGYVLTGKTSNCIIQDMLYPDICGTLTVPSMSSLVLDPNTSPLEVGCVMPTICITANFSQGSINPQGCSASPYRSGAATHYCFTGSINGLVTCGSNSAQTGDTNYTVVAGSNTWGSRACYDAGVQPISNKGTEFDSPLSAGIIGTPITSTITGIYPYYYGQITCATRPVVTGALVTGGTKVIVNAGTCTSVPFSATGQWTWFALPAACAARTYWCESALSCGTIGNPSDKYPDTCNLSVSTDRWSGISYNVYMSDTVGDVNTVAFSSYSLP